MAGIRGVVNPMPSKGKSPTGIFSTRGSQKMDSTGGAMHKDVQNAALAHDRCAPVKRDNRIKKG